MSEETNKVDGVFEGGGVKGIGLVGAVSVTEERGYRFENVAGTSAGAIVASFIAAGYQAGEMKEILDTLDYTQFKDEDTVDKIPLIGPALSLGFEKGIYEGDFFENWLRDHLARKGVHTFSDLVIDEYKDEPKYRYRLQVIASDISRGRLLVLPGDIEDYGIPPDELDVARAVRMSMSIPFFFEPVALKHGSGKTSYIVDGGLLSNFPVWIFDEDVPDPPWPTFGYKLVEPDEKRPHVIRGPFTLLAALFSTMMEAHDARYIDDHAFARTVPIPTGGVRTTDFDISEDNRRMLFESGRTAAREFLDQWDFAAYKANFRAKEPVGRRARIWGKAK